MEEKKTKKKKGKLGFILGAIIAFFIGVGIFGSTTETTEQPTTSEVKEEEATTEPTTEVTKEEATPEVTEEPTTEPEVEKEETHYISEGDTLTLEDGSNVTITKIGITSVMSDYEGRLIDFMYVYTELENNGEDKWIVYQGDCSLYADDYQIKTEFPITNSSNIESPHGITVDGIDGIENQTSIDINPGRKGKYLFYTAIPEEAIAAERVEFEIYGIPIIFKDKGEWLYEIPDGTDAEEAQIEALEREEMYQEIPGTTDGSLINIIPGEYISTDRGSIAVITVTEDGYMSAKYSSHDFTNAKIEYSDELGHYLTGIDGNWYVSFYETGLSIYNDTVEEFNMFLERLD